MDGWIWHGSNFIIYALNEKVISLKTVNMMMWLLFGSNHLLLQYTNLLIGGMSFENNQKSDFC